MTSVRVRKVTYLLASGRDMVTDWCQSRATADVFEPGVLTISGLPDGEVVQTFGPDEWTEAAVLGEDGLTDFAFHNKDAVLAARRIG